MKYLAICEDDLLFQFMRKLATRRGEVLFLVEEEGVARRIRRQGGSSQWGNLKNQSTYKKNHLEHISQAILFIRDAGMRERVYQVGGAVTVSRGMGCGTQVRVSVPGKP